MKPTTLCRCNDCGTSFEYALTNDGRIPDGCPDCDSDNVEPTNRGDE